MAGGCFAGCFAQFDWYGRGHRGRCAHLKGRSVGVGFELARIITTSRIRRASANLGSADRREQLRDQGVVLLAVRAVRSAVSAGAAAVDSVSDYVVLWLPNCMSSIRYQRSGSTDDERGGAVETITM